MDPSSVSGPNLACPDKGTVGTGNVRVHSRVAARYRCRTCRRTFVATTNTPLYRLHQPEATMTLVLTLLIHGCPIAAIVVAFGLDERTVRAWLHKAGAHAALLHDRLTVAVEARPVQAGEIRVRVRGGAVWAGVARDVGSRLWRATWTGMPWPPAAPTSVAVSLIVSARSTSERCVCVLRPVA